MSGAQEHYANLLGSVYTWFVSAPGDPFERAAAFLREHQLDRAERYLDLGAGFGAHSLALLRAGKRVTAVDFDPTLLGELRALTREHADRLVVAESDIGAFLRGATPATFDVVLCLGDTLTHLESLAAVDALIRTASRCLAPRGRLALSYRDSTGFALEGVARFREVARDARRTMHCLLEPLDAEHLRVTDLVTDVTPEGPRTRLSDYVKLRVSPERIRAAARRAELVPLRSSEAAGMLALVFEKSSA